MQLTCSFAVLAALALPAWAADVSGRVVDSSGAAVQSASVVAQHQGSGATIEQWTDEQGRYRFEDLGAGSWLLTASKAGFTPATERVQPSAAVEQHFQLQPAVITERVEVGAKVMALPEEARLIPGSVDVIDSATLARSRVFNFDEALRKVPGVYVRGEEGFGLRPNVGIRGLNPTRSSKVLLLEDGIPVTFAPYGANESYYHPPIERFEAVEVIKGAGQILYGPQTVGGVINYLTPQPPPFSTGSLTLTGGNRDYANARLDYGTTVKSIGLLFEAMRKQGQGSRENLRHGLSDFNFKAVRPFSRQTLSFKTNYWNEDSNVAYSGLRLSEWLQNPRANPFRNDFFNVDRFGASLVHSIALSPNALASTRFYGYTVERNWWRQSSNSSQRPNDAADPQCGGMQNLSTTCGNEGRLRNYAVWGVEPRVKLEQSWLGIRNEMDLGFRAHFETQDRIQQNGDRPWVRTGPVVENNERRNQAYSGFVQNRFIFGDLVVTPGVRIERIFYRRFNRLLGTGGKTALTEWVPGIGAAYSPSQRVTFFTGLHRGFAPPRTEDVVNNVTGGVVDLDPELSWNYEAGVRSRIRAGTSFDATYFRMDFENQIIPASLAGGVGATLTSAGRTRHEGLEVSGRTEWRAIAGSRHTLSLRAAYTWLPRAEFDGARFSGVSGFGSTSVTGNRLPYAPETLLNTSVGYAHATGLNAIVEAVYTGRQFGDDLNTINSSEDGQRGAIPSVVIWNITVNYPVEQWRTTFFVTTKNLLDRVYLADRVRGMIPGAPRLAQAGMRFTF